MYASLASPFSNDRIDVTDDLVQISKTLLHLVKSHRDFKGFFPHSANVLEYRSENITVSTHQHAVTCIGWTPESGSQAAAKSSTLEAKLHGSCPPTAHFLEHMYDQLRKREYHACFVYYLD